MNMAELKQLQHTSRSAPVQTKVIRREKINITTDILQALAQKPLKPTHLLYKSNLSHPRLKHYLDGLMDKNLIEVTETKTGKMYAITPNGLDFHNRCTQAMQDFNSLGV